MNMERSSTEFGFVRRLLAAFYRLAAIFLFLGAQRLLSWVVEWVTPSGLGGTLRLLDAIMALAFIVIYLSLIFEMVAVFIPRFSPRSSDSGVERTGEKPVTRAQGTPLDQ